MTSSVSTIEPTPRGLGKKQKITFLAGILFVALILLSTATIILTFNNMLGQEKIIKTVELEVRKPQAEKDSKPTLDKSEWTFEVLNGSGVAGAALNAAKKLESLGYKVIIIGNADEQTFTLTELSVAKDKFDQADLLLEDLQAEFPSATLSGELTDSTASARIILGKE